MTRSRLDGDGNAQARKFVIQERYIEWRVMNDDARPNQIRQQFVNDGREQPLPRRSSRCSRARPSCLRRSSRSGSR